MTAAPNTTTHPINPQDYGIHTSSAAAYLRTAYGEPAAIAYYNGTAWTARPMTDFHPDHPGPHSLWKPPAPKSPPTPQRQRSPPSAIPPTSTSTAHKSRKSHRPLSDQRTELAR